MRADAGDWELGRRQLVVGCALDPLPQFFTGFPSSPASRLICVSFFCFSFSNTGAYLYVVQFGNPSIAGLWKTQHVNDDNAKLDDDFFNSYYDDSYYATYDDASYFGYYYYYS
jgi:hypothetical protein